MYRIKNYKVRSMTDTTNPFSWSYGINLLKYISQKRDTFLQYLQFEVGDGSKTKFWNDLWRGDFPLKKAYLELFSSTRNEGVAVADLITFFFINTYNNFLIRDRMTFIHGIGALRSKPNINLWFLQQI